MLVRLSVQKVCSHLNTAAWSMILQGGQLVASAHHHRAQQCGPVLGVWGAPGMWAGGLWDMRQSPGCTRVHQSSQSYMSSDRMTCERSLPFFRRSMVLGSSAVTVYPWPFAAFVTVTRPSLTCTTQITAAKRLLHQCSAAVLTDAGAVLTCRILRCSAKGGLYSLSKSEQLKPCAYLVDYNEAALHRRS